jgi:Xaa-Pro aminopeptidase
MFDKEVYKRRRDALRKKIGSGIILFPGNDESPMNYGANTYHFRQDSTFLYFFGLDHPGFYGVCDPESGEDTIYGDDIDIDDIIWMGEQPSVTDLAARSGVKIAKPRRSVRDDVRTAIEQGRRVHILPPYRGEHTLDLGRIFTVPPEQVKEFISIDLIKAVISLREVKDEHEISQIEQAIDVAYEMHTTVMKMAFPGTWEREIAGTIEGIALSHGGPVSFPVIHSMDGQTLHNHYHGNLLKEGRLVITDAGCETSMHYASDITRTVPVGGSFTSQQKQIYEIVLKANNESIKAVKPGHQNMEVHMLASRIIAEGLKDAGLMKGNIEEAVNLGAHALFFPHGLGHMLGLDVHDLEGLGEDNVGYDAGIKRSDQFGLAYLRLAKALKEGFVITIEPGIYFIPALIDLWKSENRFADYINYSEVEKFRSFGGIRIEDDVLVTASGQRVLG